MSLVALDPSWRALAECRGSSYEEMVPENPESDAGAHTYCIGCRVTQPCLKDAIETDSRGGIRGGLSEAQRLPLHLVRERELALVPKSAPHWRLGRLLSVDAELELRDLADETGHVGSRNYRMRLGELYESGVSITQLLYAGAPNDRMIWRGIREYRMSLEESTSHMASEPAPENNLSKRQQQLRKRAYQNYSFLAVVAPTESARRYWHQKANSISC